MSSQPHAAILCSPGLGLLIPVLELAKQLVTHRNFTVTIFAIPSPASKTQSELLKAAATPKFFNIIELPPPDISGYVGPVLAVMMREVRPAFRSAILGMKSSLRPTVLIVDLFSTESLSIGEELGIPKYVYIASTAWFVLWVPQVDILSHPSIGGFWSHGGWNSSLESITNGVPMMVWPLYAEQRMNATMLTEELGVAVRSKVLPSKKVVGREEIKEMVRKIMVDKDGQAIRGRVKELKLSAAKAWSVGGSSYNALSQISSGNERKC